MTLIETRLMGLHVHWDDWGCGVFRGMVGSRPWWVELGPLQVRIGGE